MKTCRTCGAAKPPESFSSRRSSADGLHYSCRDCDREYQRAYRKRPQVKARQAARAQAPERPRVLPHLDKTCRRCKAAKPPRAFREVPTAIDGRHSWCIECYRKYYRELMAKRRAARKAAARGW